MAPFASTKRLQQISPHPKEIHSDKDHFEGLPRIKQVAESSTGLRVKDQVVVITGANSTLGIGRASAHQFAQNGAQALFLCDINDSFLDLHAQEIKALYPNIGVFTYKMDAADENAIKNVVGNALEKYGRLDIMFANAGTGGTPRSFGEIEKDEFMRTMNTNALSVFLATKHAAEAMLVTSASKPNPSGSIIATSSVAGLRTNAGPADYSASKAAVISLMQSAAFQLPHPQIRCNAICPAMVATEMSDAFLGEGGRLTGITQAIEKLTPMRRIAVADEVARVALFLGSGEASHVNGQAWSVCGGYTAGHPFTPT
ncbi:hypothetical protein ACLMJK_003736 [Lecanora helva]